MRQIRLAGWPGYKMDKHLLVHRAFLPKEGLCSIFMRKQAERGRLLSLLLERAANVDKNSRKIKNSREMPAAAAPGALWLARLEILDAVVKEVQLCFKIACKITAKFICLALVAMCCRVRQGNLNVRMFFTIFLSFANSDDNRLVSARIFAAKQQPGILALGAFIDDIRESGIGVGPAELFIGFLVMST